MKVVAIVQARMSSRRLPGKVLAPLAGAPSIVRMLERVARANSLSRILVATSLDASDDPLVAALGAAGIEVTRGSLDDVLERFAAAVPSGHDGVVRLTGDCPLIDAGLIDRHVARFLSEQPFAEYVSNALVRTQPDGLDVEVMRRDLLEAARAQADSAYDREHVTPWLRRRARFVPICQETDLSDLRWTLDTPEDYASIGAIYQALYPQKPDFDRFDVYRLLLARPDLIRVAGKVSLDRDEQRAVAQRIERHLAQEPS